MIIIQEANTPCQAALIRQGCGKLQIFQLQDRFIISNLVSILK